MEDLIRQIDITTLRYFYSSLFQGFATMFTLTLMFTIYYFQRSDERRYYLEDRMEHFADRKFGFEKNPEEFQKLDKFRIYGYIDEKIKMGIIKEGEELFKLKGLNDDLIKEERIVKTRIGWILLLSFFILLSSIISLYFADYLEKNKYFSFFWGGFIIAIMFIYFFASCHLIYSIVGYKIVSRIRNKFILWYKTH